MVGVTANVQDAIEAEFERRMKDMSNENP